MTKDSHYLHHGLTNIYAWSRDCQGRLTAGWVKAWSSKISRDLRLDWEKESQRRPRKREGGVHQPRRSWGKPMLALDWQLESQNLRDEKMDRSPEEELYPESSVPMRPEWTVMSSGLPPPLFSPSFICPLLEPHSADVWLRQSTVSYRNTVWITPAELPIWTASNDCLQCWRNF